MSVFYESSEDVDALAERIMERAELREIVDKLYKYTFVSNSQNQKKDKVEGIYILYNWICKI